MHFTLDASFLKSSPTQITVTTNAVFYLRNHSEFNCEFVTFKSKLSNFSKVQTSGQFQTFKRGLLKQKVKIKTMKYCMCGLNKCRH